MCHLRACQELHVGGSIATNVDELKAILSHGSFVSGWTTTMLDDQDVLGCGDQVEPAASCTPSSERTRLIDASVSALNVDRGAGEPGAADPIAAARGAAVLGSDGPTTTPAPEGCIWVSAPVEGN